MYDPSTIANNLSQLDPHVILNEGTSNEKIISFDLTYHTVEEVRIANDYFDSLIDIEAYKASCETSNPKVILKDSNYQLSPEELIWMENERILSKWDCNYFQDRYYKILDATGHYIQFAPLVPQLVNRRIRARLQKAQRAVRKWTVKARQQGETSDSQGVILHRLAYFNDIKSLIASLDSDSSGKMADMTTSAMNLLPYWNRPRLKSHTTGAEYEYENGSLLDIGWGTQDKLGRGRTPLIAHCSEIPFYKYPEKALEEALFNAKHESIWELLLMEGTAEKRDDYYHKKTKEIIEGMENGLTSFIFCFHPWCARRDLFPTATWITARSDAFARWTPSTETIAHAIKVERWIQNNEDYREVYKEVLGHPFKFDREQLFYYETEKNAAKKRNALQAFLKEKPSDPDEAFQNVGQSIYPIETIITLADRAQAVTPEVYKLRGDRNEVASILFPDDMEIDYNKPSIIIRANWNTAIPYSEFELVPIIFRGWDNFNPDNKFLIWEHPHTGVIYGNGTDPSEGLGKLVSDDTIMEIFKKGTIEYNDKQCCEFASPDIPPSQMWAPALAINTYYSPDEQLLFVPEIMDGTELVNAMIHRGWRNIHQPKDLTRISESISNVVRLGFSTNRQTRPDLVNHFNSLILGGWLDIYSMKLIEELKDLTMKTTMSAIIGSINKKILGKNDNRFMASGMVLYSLHRNEIAGREQAAWQQRIKNENSKVILKECKNPSYETDEGSIIFESEYIEEEIDELIGVGEDGY